MKSVFGCPFSRQNGTDLCDFCAEIEKKCSFIKFSFSFGKYTDFHDISITNIQIHLAVTRLSYLYPSILIIYKKECGVVNLIVCSN